MLKKKDIIYAILVVAILITLCIVLSVNDRIIAVVTNQNGDNIWYIANISKTYQKLIEHKITWWNILNKDVYIRDFYYPFGRYITGVDLDTSLVMDTDLNAKCINFILNNIEGDKVLDITCGKGFLSKEIAKKNNALKVYGVDIMPSKGIPNLPENLTFIKGSVENIPFDDNFFDTTIYDHTLEHTPNIDKAVSELRRVTRKKLIIVVPKQREYKYTFDLHLNFFPYEFSLLKAINHKNGKLVTIGGDFVYYETK